jgi:hypothetical protein
MMIFCDPRMHFHVVAAAASIRYPDRWHLLGTEVLLEIRGIDDRKIQGTRSAEQDLNQASRTPARLTPTNQPRR